MRCTSVEFSVWKVLFSYGSIEQRYLHERIILTSMTFCYNGKLKFSNLVSTLGFNYQYTTYSWKYVNKSFIYIYIRQALHVTYCKKNKNSTRDMLWKIRSLYNFIRSPCLELEVEPDLGIDEQLVPLKCQLCITSNM